MSGRGGNLKTSYRRMCNNHQGTGDDKILCQEEKKSRDD